MNLPSAIQESLQAATQSEIGMFKSAQAGLSGLGLDLYSTDTPDIRATHPENGTVFVTLTFPTKIEVRVDSCPVDLLSTAMQNTVHLKHYDRGKRPLWAVLRPGDGGELEDALTIVERVLKQRSLQWGQIR